MQSAKIISVENERYEFRHLDPIKASRLLVRVVKPLLRPLGEALSGAKGLAGILDSNMDGMNLGSAFGALADNLNDDEFNRLLLELLSVVRLETGMEINASVHFEGRVFHMHKVAFESFKYNFDDFLAETSGALGFLRRTTTRAQAGSTGSSGESSSRGSQPLPK
jgi:hypothetical protein